MKKTKEEKPKRVKPPVYRTVNELYNPDSDIKEAKYNNDPKFRRLTDTFYSFLISNEFTIDSVEQAMNLAWNKYQVYTKEHGLRVDPYDQHRREVL